MTKSILQLKLAIFYLFSLRFFIAVRILNYYIIPQSYLMMHT